MGLWEAYSVLNTTKEEGESVFINTYYYIKVIFPNNGYSVYIEKDDLGEWNKY